MNQYCDPTPIATTEEYVKALLRLRDSFQCDKPFSSSDERKMLLFHYGANQHTITATQLAREVGLTSYSLTNLKYGMLARRITELLKKTLPPLEGTKDPHWWRVLAYCNDGVPISYDGQVEWIMRDELCRALEQLRWVTPAA
jgi:hypothetical protein